MPAPKRLRILTAVADRLADLEGDVFLDRREPQADELPCYLVFAGDRTAEQTQNRRTRCAMAINVMGFRRLDDGDSEVIGAEILADLMAAIELDDDTLGGLVNGVSGALSMVSESVFLPEVGDNVVGAEIVYSAPHIRIDGDPEIV
jgi:hypothetical protein